MPFHGKGMLLQTYLLGNKFIKESKEKNVE